MAVPADAAIDDLLEGLNPPQRDAVTHGEGPLLILAGAGSGKTRVLTHRIAYLLRTKQARPSEILAITFTNKAAAEMRERVELLVGRATRAMWVMTFHAACARMLRSHADKLGYTRQFTIYDAADQRRLIKKCLDDLGFDPKRYTPRAMQSQISDAKNRLRSPDEYAELVGSNFEQTVADVYQLYNRELHRMNAMDFDDLLVRSVHLLERFQEVHDHYAQTFRWVMVDEYQDTNRVQYRWLQLLTSEHRNLAVVGDDAQSIYGFRGADIRNILEFQDDYPDAHVVKLEQNYRSTQTILDAANAVISHNRGQMPKHLWTDVGEGDKVRVREMADEFAEARWVTAEIQRLVDEGVSRNEIAVFYRTNAQSRVLEDMLVRAGVAYQVIGGPKFYERAEIKDAIQYLTFLVNPQDATAFTRIANSPRRGIGQTSLSRVIAHAAAMEMSVWEAAEGEVPGLATAARKSLTRFMDTMRGLRERAESGPPGRGAARRAAGRDRVPGRAAGRADDRGPGPAREPRRADHRGPPVRHQHARGRRHARRVPAADVAGRRRGHDPRRRGPRDADDDAQRQGPRVPDRVHDRDGGGHLPALALDRGQPDRGGAAARVRRPDARDARPHAHVRAPPPVLRRRRRAQPAVAVPRRAAGRADRPAGPDRARVPGARADRVAGRRRPRHPRRPSDDAADLPRRRRHRAQRRSARA